MMYYGSLVPTLVIIYINRNCGSRGNDIVGGNGSNDIHRLSE